jgi:hypothetical protein
MMDTLVVAACLGAITAHMRSSSSRALRLFAYRRSVLIIYGVFLLVAVTLSRACSGWSAVLQRQPIRRRVVIYGGRMALSAR